MCWAVCRSATPLRLRILALSARLRVGLRVCTQHWHTLLRPSDRRATPSWGRPGPARRCIGTGQRGHDLVAGPHGRPAWEPEATGTSWWRWHIRMPVPRTGCMWARRPSAWVGRRGGKSPWAQPRRGAAAVALKPTCNPNPTSRLGTFIGLCRPSGLKFANLFAVWYSSTPLYSFASEIITARSTVRAELQSEIHFHPRVHVIPEVKSIPVGLADGGSTAPLLPRHVRLRHCAVLRLLRLPRCFLM